MGKTVLITGASKGLGKALAEKFKKEGFTVLGVSRTPVQDLLDFHIQADLSREEEVEKVYKTVEENRFKIDVLINNAGIGLYESWEKTDMEQLKRLFEINFFTPVRLTKLFLPHLKERKGTVINVSSVAGKLYVPYMGGYCASKYGLNAFSDSLRAEVMPEGVKVLNLIIGRINTGFSKNAMGSKKPPDTPFGGSAEGFAEAVYKAYRKGKREITYPFWYRYFILLAKAFPQLYDRIAYKKWNSP
ncbi:MAG: SDR family oxidoreductase [Aquificae bacterium]|nr:SDR family oxidoreductase [Aquificota bacterium]